MRKWLFIGGMIAVASLSLGFLLTKGPKDYAIPSQGFELPEYDLDEDIVRHIGYTASYNHGTLVPNWVAWELTKSEACARLNGQFTFSRDPDVKEPKACREDYGHSGWDKGHMAPRADMRWSQKALDSCRSVWISEAYEPYFLARAISDSSQANSVSTLAGDSSAEYS